MEYIGRRPKHVAHVVSSSKDAAHSNGIADRAVDIVKDAYTKALDMFRLDSDQLIMPKVPLAKNSVP